MAKKQNPILAAFEAKLRAEFAQEKAQMEADFKDRLSMNTEINLISMTLAGSRLGFLGEKRAGAFLEEQVETKMKLADDLLKDAEDDPSLEYTKADLARSMIQVLGPDNWPRYQYLFPLLHDYWVEGDDTDGKVRTERV